jgi:methyl-accepting chemotaxis protein
MKAFRRRHFLIDSLQYRLLVIHLVYFLTIVVVFAAALFAPLMLDLRAGPQDWSQKLESANMFLSLHKTLWPAVLILFLLLGAHAALVTHRIAGPLYRFRKIFDSVGKGDLSIRAVIRKRDYLTQDEASLNQMIDSLNKAIAQVKAHSNELSAIVEELKDSSKNGSSLPRREITERLEQQLERMRCHVDLFKLDGDPKDDAEAAQANPKEVATTS